MARPGRAPGHARRRRIRPPGLAFRHRQRIPLRSPHPPPVDLHGRGTWVSFCSSSSRASVSPSARGCSSVSPMPSRLPVLRGWGWRKRPPVPGLSARRGDDPDRGAGGIHLPGGKPRHVRGIRVPRPGRHPFAVADRAGQPAGAGVLDRGRGSPLRVPRHPHHPPRALHQQAHPDTGHQHARHRRARAGLCVAGARGCRTAPAS